MSTDSLPSWAELRDGALERLVEQAHANHFYGLHEQLLEACAEVIAQSRGSSAIAFLGRSPESLYDLTRALLRDTRRAPRPLLLPFSLREGTVGTVARLAGSGDALDGLARHLDQLQLGPRGIAQLPRGVAFVDCVAWGTTFGNLDEALDHLARRGGIDPRAVSARVLYLGLTKASLGWTHWRNDEESQGARFFAEGRAAVVPISARLWTWLAERSPSTMDRHPPERWGEPPRLPALDERRAQAIRLARDLFMLGLSRDVRRAFAAKLARRASRERPWLGALVTALLRSTRGRAKRCNA